MSAPETTGGAPAAVGVDVGGHGIKAVLTTSEGRVLDRWADHDPSPEGRGVEAVLDRVVRAVRALATGLPVGVAVPGFFDTREGVVRSSPNFPTWRDVPLASLLRGRLGRVVVENDANAAVLGEAWSGAARGLSDVVLITLGTGVGTGFLVNGGLVRGARGAGGEGGHVVIEPGGRPCGCGGRGCLETYASGPGIVKTAAEEWARAGTSNPPTTAASVFDALREGEAPAVRTIERFAHHLARGITALVHVFAPAAVVLAGGVAGSLEDFRGPLEAAVASMAIPACSADALPIRGAELGSSAGAVGAARSALVEAR
jgi:glucokinase